MKIVGKVVYGDGMGKELGFPTLNVEPEGDFHSLDSGVYICDVMVGDEKYKGAMHYGPRETIGDGVYQLEVHLLEFDGDLYDKKVEIDVLKKIRDVVKFDSLKELKNQIERDLEVIYNYYRK